jgi:DNA-binding PadR family transcriptional regulator
MKQNQTAWLILGMLSVEPNRSGYDIRRAVESSVSYFWHESYGQIYPTLKRLAAEGLIIPRQPGLKGRPERQEYSLSAKGRARLEEWLAAPYRDQPLRSEFLLKLFFGRAAPHDACAQHIRTFQENNRRQLATLVELERQVKARQRGNPHLPFWLLTLSCGICFTRAAIAWSEQALASLTPKGKRAVPRKTAPRLAPPLQKGKLTSLRRPKSRFALKGGLQDD